VVLREVAEAPHRTIDKVEPPYVHRYAVRLGSLWAQPSEDGRQQASPPRLRLADLIRSGRKGDRAAIGRNAGREQREESGGCRRGCLCAAAVDVRDPELG